MWLLAPCVWQWFDSSCLFNIVLSKVPLLYLRTGVPSCLLPSIFLPSLALLAFCAACIACKISNICYCTVLIAASASGYLMRSGRSSAFPGTRIKFWTIAIISIFGFMICIRSYYASRLACWYPACCNIDSWIYFSLTCASRTCGLNIFLIFVTIFCFSLSRCFFKILRVSNE